MELTIKAEYVSVWDGGTVITTMCDFNPETKTASNIESVDVDVDDEVLIKEYVQLFESEELILTFKDEDNGRSIVDGQYEEPY
jgi:hypothetical protein